MIRKILDRSSLSNWHTPAHIIAELVNADASTSLQ